MYTATLLRTKVLRKPCFVRKYYFRTFVLSYLSSYSIFVHLYSTKVRCTVTHVVNYTYLCVHLYCTCTYTRTCSFFKFIKIYFSTETTEIHQKDTKNSPCCNRISRSRINARIIINNMSERKAVIKNADMSEVYPNISRVVVFKFGRNKMFIPVLDSSGSPGKKRVCASILHAQPPLPNLFLWIVLF